MALLLSRLFLRQNSLLKPLFVFQRWMIQGFFLRLHIPLTILWFFFIKLLITMFSMPCLSWTLGKLTVPPIVLKNCASVLAPCLVKLFHLCLSTSTFPFCWNFGHIQPVPKKGDRSDPSSYRPLALNSCSSEVFKSFPSKKILKHLSNHNQCHQSLLSLREWTIVCCSSS